MFKILGAFLQKLIELVGAALTFLAALFPDSPFQVISNSDFSALISQINFFLPVYEFIAIGQAWLIAVGIYYLYATFARWMKSIE